MKTVIAMLFAACSLAVSAAFAAGDEPATFDQRFGSPSDFEPKAPQQNEQTKGPCDPGMRYDATQSPDSDKACVPDENLAQQCEQYSRRLAIYPKACSTMIQQTGLKCRKGIDEATAKVKASADKIKSDMEEKIKSDPATAGNFCPEILKFSKETQGPDLKKATDTCDEEITKASNECNRLMEEVYAKANARPESCAGFGDDIAKSYVDKIHEQLVGLEEDREKFNKEFTQQIAAAQAETDKSALNCKKLTKAANDDDDEGDGKKPEKVAKGGGERDTDDSSSSDKDKKKKKKDGDMMSALAGALPGLMGMMGAGQGATAASMPLTGQELDPTSCYRPENVGSAQCLCLLNNQCRTTELPGTGTFASLSPSGGAALTQDAGAGNLDLGNAPLPMPEFKNNDSGGVGGMGGYVGGGGGMNTGGGNFKPDPAPGRPRSALSADILQGVNRGGAPAGGLGLGGPRFGSGEPRPSGGDSARTASTMPLPNIPLFLPQPERSLANIAEARVAGTAGPDKLILAPASSNLFGNVVSPYRGKWPTLYVDEQPPK